ncbi:MAG: hypothetical protein AAF713_16915 [Pseudomonadota bacterium]
MAKVFTASVLIGVLAVGAATDAGAWERKSSVTGWRGTGTVDASGSCADRACSRNASRTGPNGRTWSRQRNRSCADGSCSGSRTTTGPNGESRMRETSITR